MGLFRSCTCGYVCKAVSFNITIINELLLCFESFDCNDTIMIIILLFGSTYDINIHVWKMNGHVVPVKGLFSDFEYIH